MKSVNWSALGGEVKSNYSISPDQMEATNPGRLRSRRLRPKTTFEEATKVKTSFGFLLSCHSRGQVCNLLSERFNIMNFLSILSISHSSSILGHLGGVLVVLGQFRRATSFAASSVGRPEMAGMRRKGNSHILLHNNNNNNYNI